MGAGSIGRPCSKLPRKNGKSALGSAIALYLLLMDGEPGAAVYSVAGDRDQARVVFGTAKQMIEASPEIHATCHPRIYRDVIEIPATHSIYRVLSSDAPRKHGLNPSGVIVDELHVQPNRELWDAMSTAGGTRREPLTLAMTTAGFDRHSIAFELHEYARQIREGTIHDPTFFSKDYGAPDDADWTDRAVWRAANPALGAFLSDEFLEQEFIQAAALPARQNTFRRLYLSQWTEQSTRWIDLAAWDACSAPVDRAALKGRRCFAGLDLASTTDLSAVVLVFPADDGSVDVLPFFFLPEDGLHDRALRDHVPYTQWRDAGLLITTSGNVIDYDVIRAQMRTLAAEYAIAAIHFDRWNASQLIHELQTDGAVCAAMGQGFASLTAPTRELETRILSRRLRHGGHPILRWMAASVAAEQDAAGNIKPSKSKSTARIDGIVALIMALDGVLRGPAPTTSIYEHPNFDPSMVLL